MHRGTPVKWKYFCVQNVYKSIQYKKIIHHTHSIANIKRSTKYKVMSKIL